MDNLKNLTIQELIEYDKVHFVRPFIPPESNTNIYLWNSYEYKYSEYRNSLPIKLELERSYNELLEKILIELENLSLSQDAITIIITLSKFLIPNAYFSVGNFFQKNFRNSNLQFLYLNFTDTPFFEGHYITNGQGVCRHVNSFICDILNQKGTETYLVGGEILNPKTQKEKYRINHTVIATVEKNKYHLIDGYNQTYAISEGKEYFFDVNNIYYAFIPHFTIGEYYLYSYKEPFYLLPYQEIIHPNELSDRIRDIYKIMLVRGYHQFNRFKEENLELYKRINTLTELEDNRTLFKELPKLLRISQQKKYRN